MRNWKHRKLSNSRTQKGRGKVMYKIGLTQQTLKRLMQSKHSWPKSYPNFLHTFEVSVHQNLHGWALQHKPGRRPSCSMLPLTHLMGKMNLNFNLQVYCYKITSFNCTYPAGPHTLGTVSNPAYLSREISSTSQANSHPRWLPPHKLPIAILVWQHHKRNLMTKTQTVHSFKKNCALMIKDHKRGKGDMSHSHLMLKQQAAFTKINLQHTSMQFKQELETTWEYANRTIMKIA